MSDCEADHGASSICLDEFHDAVLHLIAPPSHTPRYHVFNRTSLIKARALALLLWKDFRIQTSILQPWGDVIPASKHAVLNSELFRSMAIHANACAKENFLPPIVIRVACWLLRFQPRYGLGARKLPRLPKLASLWKAYDDYVLTQTAGERQRLAKMSKAPNMYRCAADACGIQAVHRSALRKCAGECHEEVKPYYCSRECQRKHWFIHRYACQYSAPHANPIIEDDGDPNWIDVETYKPRYDDGALVEAALHANNEGA
ncbi:hypothetical protein V8D89_010669, partial [Ganoderma adspersum]